MIQETCGNKVKIIQGFLYNWAEVILHQEPKRKLLHCCILYLRRIEYVTVCHETIVCATLSTFLGSFDIYGITFEDYSIWFNCRFLIRSAFLWAFSIVMHFWFTCYAFRIPNLIKWNTPNSHSPCLRYRLLTLWVLDSTPFLKCILSNFLRFFIAMYHELFILFTTTFHFVYLNFSWSELIKHIRCHISLKSVCQIELSM